MVSRRATCSEHRGNIEKTLPAEPLDGSRCQVEGRSVGAIAMKNHKADKRRKRLDHKLQWQAEKHRRAQYPDFIFDEREGNSEFMELVKAAVRCFDFSEVSPGEQRAFRDMKERGFGAVLNVLQAGMRMAQQIDPENREAKIADIIWVINLASIVLRKIPEAELRRHLPFNDARFLFIDKKIMVQFRSLLRVGEGEDAFYYSRRRPTVEVDGKHYIVAFSKHAIEAIGKRIIPLWLTYGGHGDLYAYLEECVFFETCTLRNNFLAFTFYDRCTDARFWQHRYVEKVLGKENLDASKGDPYYRVGYCPADLIDNQFIRARTLLFPGFSKTPEYVALQQSGSTVEEKSRLGDLATKSDANTLQTTDDFSALKWFHENGVPQVIQTNRLVFDVFGTAGV
jgi:hypothetical protein